MRNEGVMSLCVKSLLLAVTVLVVSCNNPNRVCCTPPNADVSFSIVDNEGNDRLNPKHAHPLKERDISSYHLEREGEKERSSIDIFENTQQGIYVLRIFLSNNVLEDGQTRTLVEFSDGQVDTLRMEPIGKEGKALSKLWYNGNLVYSSEDPKLFEITKPVVND